MSTVDTLCSCLYCVGSCEIFDESSMRGEPCEYCLKEHMLLDEETGELYPRERGSV